MLLLVTIVFLHVLEIVCATVVEIYYLIITSEHTHTATNAIVIKKNVKNNSAEDLNLMIDNVVM